MVQGLRGFNVCGGAKPTSLRAKIQRSRMHKLHYLSLSPPLFCVETPCKMLPFTFRVGLQFPVTLPFLVCLCLLGDSKPSHLEHQESNSLEAKQRNMAVSNKVSCAHRDGTALCPCFQSHKNLYLGLEAIID